MKNLPPPLVQRKPSMTVDAVAPDSNCRGGVAGVGGDHVGVPRASRVEKLSSQPPRT